MIESGLVTFLRSFGDVTALIGGASRVRIFPYAIPQKVPVLDQVPCIIYSLDSEQREYTYCGVDGLVESTIQLDSIAPLLRDARDLSAAVRAHMIGFRGTWGTTIIRDVRLSSSLSTVDMDPGLMRVIDSYDVWFEEG